MEEEKFTAPQEEWAEESQPASGSEEQTLTQEQLIQRYEKRISDLMSKWHKNEYQFKKSQEELKKLQEEMDKIKSLGIDFSSKEQLEKVLFQLKYPEYAPLLDDLYAYAKGKGISLEEAKEAPLFKEQVERQQQRSKIERNIPPTTQRVGYGEREYTPEDLKKMSDEEFKKVAKELEKRPPQTTAGRWE
ncbi:MAG: hypothetical protein C4347_01685 [Patescibacteria group bacterium]